MMLLDSLHDPDYSHEALYYLDALFGIHIKARPLPDGDYYEYIEDRMGNIVNLLEAMATPEEIERAYWSRDYGRVHRL